MSASDPTSRAADLLAGPRGRRLLLEFTLDAADTADAADTEDTATGTAHPLNAAVFEVSDELDPQRDWTARYFRIVADDGPPDAAPVEPEAVEPETVRSVARRLTGFLATHALPEPTPELLDAALDVSVTAAMYWQEPDGADALCSTPEMREALVPAAEHLAASPLTDWWWSAPDMADQWTVTWGEDATPFPVPDAAQRADHLAEFSAKARDGERRSATSFERRRRVEDAAGGEWWSVPVWCVPMTTRRWPGGTAEPERGAHDPVGALFVEDRWVDEFCATAYRPPTGARILEITGADDWAGLCREFPLDVTWSHRREWFQTTGRDSKTAGPWLIPDWSAVAGTWDAVHLTVAGYLAAATRSIPVPGGGGAADGQDAASVIAGWGPDVTYWLR